MIRAFFQIEGILQVLRERLKRVVRKRRPLGPKCFKWRLERLFGPRAGEFFEDLMASATLVTEREEK